MDLSTREELWRNHAQRLHADNTALVKALHEERLMANELRRHLDSAEATCTIVQQEKDAALIEMGKLSANLESARGALSTATNDQQAAWDAIERIEEVYMGIVEYQETPHGAYREVSEMQAAIERLTIQGKTKDAHILYLQSLVDHFKTLRNLDGVRAATAEWVNAQTTSSSDSSLATVHTPECSAPDECGVVHIPDTP